MSENWSVNNTPISDTTIGSVVGLKLFDGFEYYFKATVETIYEDYISVIIKGVFDEKLRNEITGGDVLSKYVGKKYSVKIFQIF